MLGIVASSLGLTPATAEAESETNAKSKANGKELYQLCAQCHGDDGLGMQMALAPAIAGQKDWYLLNQITKFRNGQRGTHFYDIAGMRMRPMALSLRTDQDIADVVAYVAALPPTKPAATLEGGDPEKGKGYFQVCMACHGPNGEGMQPLNAPTLNHSSDWYLLTQLTNFRTGIRGANPADTTGATMRPMSMTLPDEQALQDVIAYIMTLSDSE